MNPTDPLDDLIRGAAPAPLADEGFVARTMAAVDATALPRRPAPMAPLAIAHALAAEQRRHEAQARAWRWGRAGVAAGVLLLLLAMMLSPGGDAPTVDALPQQWLPLCLLLSVGAIWLFWRELREA